MTGDLILLIQHSFYQLWYYHNNIFDAKGTTYLQSKGIYSSQAAGIAGRE
jgi:hypothetical protein